MEKEKIEKYKQVLEKERLFLLAEIKKDEIPENFGDDLDDESEETENFGNELAMGSGLKDRLDEIDLAISKIMEGTYGICEKCGGKIEEEILDADPESRYCRKCKEEENL
jgi:DnaK suppressor protein